ncbi:MAG: ZIP family metal transporter [Flavobacteriaceae bacterium]|nr:ZIP family metal transporter [Flavobacteriaceae bacterium]
MNLILLFLSVIAGYGLGLLFQKKEIKNTSIILAFSGAFLLSVTLFELLPEVFEQPSKELGLLVMIGILLQIILDFFSKGAEHGHVHLDSGNLHFPWLLFLSLSIHSLIEGAPAAANDSILLGVLVHKVPIALILTFFFLNAGYSNLKTFAFLFMFALMTPIGSFLSSEVSFLKFYQNEINAVAIGIFLHVSTTILFESSKDHKFNLAKLTAIVLAVIFAYFV